MLNLFIACNHLPDCGHPREEGSRGSQLKAPHPLLAVLVNDLN